MVHRNVISTAVTVMLLFVFSSLVLAESEHVHDGMNMAPGWDLVTITITLSLTLFLVLGMVMFFTSFQGKNLMDFALVRNIMKSPFYPKILQLPTLIFFVFIFYHFFWGSLSYAQNPGSILTWTLWWPLVPLTFIMFGRMWCVVCPLPVIGDFFQKFVHPTQKPGAFLMRYGIWITDGLFIAITLFDRLYGMVDTPWLSGLVFILILFGAIVISLRYERRTFCKHLCFLGGVSGNYSMLSGMSIESKDKAVCIACKTKACYFGGKAEGCPYFNVMPAKNGMRNCTFCANCIKNCPNDNIALRIRGLGSELWSHTRVSFSESFFAKLMIGIVIIQNLGMLAIWGNLNGWLMQFGIGEKLAILILYFAAVALPLILMTFTSALSSRLQTTKSSLIDNFAAFGYAFIPIDVAGHIAHNLFHLVSEGKSIIGGFIALITGRVDYTGGFAGPSTIAGMQFALIIVGGLGTLYVAYKIARAREATHFAALRILLPHAVLLVIIFGVNLWLFATPMAHRGG